MLPYWLLFGAFSAGALQHRKANVVTGRAGPLLLLAAFATALMIGLRYEVGGDWVNYEEMFDRTAVMSFDEVLGASDPGYMLLNWIGKSLGYEIWFVNLICGIIFTWGLVRFAKVQPNPWLAMVVAIPYLVIVVAMGYSRQGVAIGLIMAGLATERQSLLKLSIYIFFAAAFHKTAVIILPLVGLAMTRTYFVNGILMAVSAWVFYRYFLEAQVDTLLIRYIDTEQESEGAAIRVAMNLLPAGLFLLFASRFELSEFQTRLWRNFSLLSFALLVLLFVLPSSTVVDRLALYMIPLQLFVLSRLPDAFQEKNGRRNMQLVFFVIAYSALVQYVWLNFAYHAYDWLPYKMYSVLPG